MIFLLLLFSIFSKNSIGIGIVLNKDSNDIDFLYNVTCKSDSSFNPQCLQLIDSNDCGIVIKDNVFSIDESQSLLNLAHKGFNVHGDKSAPGGPSILDINTGYIRDSKNGLENMHTIKFQSELCRGAIKVSIDGEGKTS